MNKEVNDIKILIVEDEQLTALVLKETLESMGFTVTAVVDAGDQAIAKAIETRPHLVLMDILIEGDLDGIEIAGQIRREFDIPVIFLTAFANEETMERAKQAGPFAYLIKPYNERELKFIIEIAIYKKTLERELKESEEKYRTLFDNAGAPIIYYDLDGRILLINSIGAANLGGTPGDFIGKSLYRLLPKTADKIKERIQHIAHSGKGASYEDYTELSTGNRWFSSNLQPVRDANGKIFAVQVVSQDITLNKQTEGELRKERDRAQRYLDVAGVMIVAINTGHEVELINQKGCAVLGYSEEEIVGKNWFDHFIPENDKAKVKKILTRLLKGEIQSNRYFENLVLTKSGEKRIIAWNNTLLKDESGRIAGTLSSGEDITERKRVEDALRESEERYRTLQENIPVGIFRSTPEGKMLSANPAMVMMMGYQSEEEMLTAPIIETYLVPEQREELLGLLKDKGVVTGFEAQFKRKDHSTFWGALNVKGLADKQGRLIQMDGIMADITQRKKMEEEMLKAEKLESLGILAGGIAHDFNNILASILVNVGLAKMNIEHHDKVTTKLSDIEKAISRAKNLTQQLLTFSKGGAPVRNPTSIAQLLKETADFASSGTNVKCHCTVPANPWNANIDEGQISQVIQNLTINAKQAMPRGGVIQIAADNVTIGTDDGLPLREDRYIKITVQDQGIGIPPNHLDNIFDPFFTTKQKGSGLGLSTAYSIIKNHNGLITVQSELGKGTTFYIYLPASGEEEVKKEELPEEQMQKTPTAKGKILLMDDEDEVLEATTEVLREIGYTVEPVIDGTEVIERYKEAQQSGQPFDLVMMDLVVPGGLGGKETVKELLKIDPTAKTVVSTGYSTDPVMANYKEYGFAGAVSKPYRIKDLSSVLKEVLAGADK